MRGITNEKLEKNLENEDKRLVRKEDLGVKKAYLKKLYKAVELVENGCKEAEACRRTGIPESKFKNFLYSDTIVNKVSKSSTVSEREEYKRNWKYRFLKDLIGGDVCVREDFDSLFNNMLTDIPERQAFILCERYKNDRTLEEIGLSLGITKQSVSNNILDVFKYIRETIYYNSFKYGMDNYTKRLRERFQIFSKNYKEECKSDGRTVEEVFFEKIREETPTYSINQLYPVNQYEVIEKIMSNYNKLSTMSILDLPEEKGEVSLSIRVKTALKRRGINNLGELYLLSFEDISSLRNIGAVSVIEIIEYMHRKGYPEFPFKVQFRDYRHLIDVSEK